MLQRYTRPDGEPVAQAMQTEELLSYLRQISDPDQAPLDAVLSQAEAIGDPALPSSEQTAILRWLDSSLEMWEQQFSLDELLASQLRRLTPLLASAAICDPVFLQPGAHALHQLLDTVQAGAIGWQPRLGRAGQALQQKITDTVDAALAEFEAGNTDLASLSSAMQAFVERDRARASRMTQRLVAAEHGRTKKAEVKLQAAQMINAALTKYPATPNIGELLKGPWYASAQLVLHKFGGESPQWQQMEATTDSLLESLQTKEDEEGRRQHLFEVATQLPRNLKRWLLTLHHDLQAISDAVAVVESAHLRLLRQQTLELEHIEAIPETATPIADQGDEARPSGAAVRSSQWFLVETDDTGLRIQLVLKNVREQQLLFANQVGMRELQLGFSEFDQMLEQEQAKPLNSGASFSRSLACAAGIESAEELEKICAAGEQFRQGKQRGADSSEGLEEERLAREEQLEQQRLEREWETAKRRQSEEQEAEKRAAREKYERDNPGHAGEQLAEARSGQAASTSDAGQQPPSAASEEPELNIPMGAWLGFHDGDTPLMAKLAVHDHQQDMYTFVNRQGIKMRELSRRALLDLMDKEMVDILETRSNFREAITRTKSHLDDQES